MSAQAWTHEVVLVRHGETTGESSIRLNGATDVPLSEHGRAQMRAVGEALAREAQSAGPVDRVLVSPLSRSLESGRLVWPSLAPTVAPGFREVDFGEWERLTYAEVAARDPARYAELRLGQRDFQFPGGDSRQGFFDRVAAATREALAPARLEGRRTLVVVHKGTIKAIASTLLGEHDSSARRSALCDLGSIHRFVLQSGGGWRCTAWNEVEHLGALHLPDHNA